MKKCWSCKTEKNLHFVPGFLTTQEEKEKNSLPLGSNYPSMNQCNGSNADAKYICKYCDTCISMYQQFFPPYRGEILIFSKKSTNPFPPSENGQCGFVLHQESVSYQPQNGWAPEYSVINTGFSNEFGKVLCTSELETMYQWRGQKPRIKKSATEAKNYLFATEMAKKYWKMLDSTGQDAPEFLFIDGFEGSNESKCIAKNKKIIAFIEGDEMKKVSLGCTANIKNYNPKESESHPSQPEWGREMVKKIFERQQRC